MPDHSNIWANRSRPEMVVGDTGVNGLHQLACLMLDGGYSDARRGTCQDFMLEVGADGALTVVSTGRAASPEELAEAVLGRTMQKSSRRMELKLGWDSMLDDWGWGVSLPVALALSSRYEVDTWDGARQLRLSGVEGRPMGKPREVHPAEPPPVAAEKSLRIRLVPDATLFETTTLDAEKLTRRCREMAFLAPGLRVLFTDHRTGESTQLHYAGGIVERLRELTGDVSLHPPEPLSFDAQWYGLRIRCVLHWCDDESGVYSYVKSVPTRRHGVHVNGVFLALQEALSVLTGAQARAFPRERLERGLRAIIALEGSGPDMSYWWPTDDRLDVDDLAHAVRDQLVPRMVEALREHPLLPWLVEHARARPRPAVVMKRRPRY
ncbi:DNA gyrase subunit B [Pyxidicoccus parkwayensis]|uniref:DNA topoisomerase (ATP-hydrolyzing) n=1 Tax=Pyxidicoccus parkwayensis TaxID=2813578 RepID=A0ABX7NX95_9BACT|nr:DNA gyrase subunit B [Pyxidicoccus parkwaysis]QSQ23546.1 DNA gyrase subunit B [Pyxidicoccus parkwaysis]